MEQQRVRKQAENSPYHQELHNLVTKANKGFALISSQQGRCINGCKSKFYECLKKSPNSSSQMEDSLDMTYVIYTHQYTKKYFQDHITTTIQKKLPRKKKKNEASQALILDLEWFKLFSTASMMDKTTCFVTWQATLSKALSKQVLISPSFYCIKY